MSRRDQLQQLIDRYAKGSQADFARLIGRAAPVVWQYISGRREMGEKLARHIEQRLRLPPGWMDQPNDQGFAADAAQPGLPAPGSRVVAWETLADLPDAAAYVSVPHFDVRLSAGDGACAEWVDHPENEPLVFRLRWFQARGVRPQDCRALYVRGASMEPTLLDGDTVLIDVTRTEVQDDTVAAVLYQGGLYIKRLFRLPGGGVELRSDNPRHPSPKALGADVDSLIVLGRMIWRAG